MTPEEIVDLIMPPPEPLEVVVEVFGGVARVAQESPGVVVRIVDYTAEGDLVAYAGEVTPPGAADGVPASSAAPATSLHIEERS